MLPRGLFPLAVLLPLAASAVEVDAFDRRVPTDTGRPKVVLLTNDGSAPTVAEPMPRLMFALRELNPIVVVDVDLRGVPRLVRPIARAKIRSKHKAGLEAFRRECAAHGAPEPPDIEGSLFFVPDWKGTAHQAAGLGKGFETSVVVMYDARGREITRGAFPADAERLEQAMRDAFPGQIAPPPEPPP